MTVEPDAILVPFSGSEETARPALTVSLATSFLANFRPASSMVFLAESSSWPLTSGTSTMVTVALGVGVGRGLNAPEAHRPATTARATNRRNTSTQTQV